MYAGPLLRCPAPWYNESRMEGIAHLIIAYRYLILFPLAFFEGPIVAFVVGTLAAAGYFNVFGAYGILILGDLIPDTGYYLLGRYGERKALITRAVSAIGIREDHFSVIRHLWHNHGKKTMFFSKLAYGLSTPFLISAGLVHMPMKRFLSYALPITMIQYAILLFLGYYFSNSFKLVSQSIHDAQIIVAAVVVVAVGYYFLTRFMRKKLLQESREN